MPSEKLTRILLRQLTLEQIATMSEEEGWVYVYSHEPPRREKRAEICFTGFLDTERHELETRAEATGLYVVTCVTKALAFLCIGDNPGPAKLAKAQSQRVVIITRAEFENLAATGEIPGS